MWHHGYFEPSRETGRERAVYPIESVPMEKDYRINRLGSSTSTAVPRTANNPERAVMLLNVMHTIKGRDLFNTLIYGIEGEHYNAISENRIDTSEFAPKPGDPWKYRNNGWVLGNCYYQWETQNDMEGWWDFIKDDIHGNAIVSPAMGLKPDTEPILNQLAQVRAIQGEYEKGLNYGALPNHEQAYEEFVQKMKSAGSDKIVEELQKQVDAFLKSK